MKKHIRSIVIVWMMVMLFSISIVFAASGESEPNNSRAEANAIQMGSTVYGSTSDNGGNDKEDFFKFAAPINGTAKLTLYADKAVYQPDITGVKVWITDANNNQIGDVFDGCATASGASVTFPVSSGKTYYIRCCGSYYNFYEAVDYHLNVGYSIGRTNIKKIKAGKKQFEVTWSKKAKASFYQVQYIKKSAYDDYGWNKAKTVNISNKKKCKTIKKLAKKKRYYVRVRVARKIAGATYYSAWSSKKAVKTK